MIKYIRSSYFQLKTPEIHDKQHLEAGVIEPHQEQPREEIK